MPRTLGEYQPFVFIVYLVHLANDKSANVKGTLNFARRHSFRVTDQSFGPRTTKIGM